MEKIKKARGISIVLLFMLVFQMIIPINFAYGDDISEYTEVLPSGGTIPLSDVTTSSAINATVNLVFKDNKGNILNHEDSSVSIPFDASVNLWVRLDIKDMNGVNDPNDENYIDISQDYVIKVAEQIKISENKVIPINHPTDENVQIATAYINVNGTVTVMFLPAINDYDAGRFIQVEADGNMDVSELGGGGQQTLEFEFPGKTEYVNVRFNEKVEKVTVEKSGIWDKVKNEITWTITVKANTTPKNLSIENVVINDAIGSGQTWKSYTASSDAIYDDENKTFTFSKLQDGETKTIKIVTEPSLSAFTPENEGLDVTLTNTVEGTFGEGGVIDNKTASVKSTVDFINKTGAFVSGATRDKNVIKWTIDINNNNLNMPAGTSLEDIIPQGLKLNSTSVKINNNPITSFAGAVSSLSDNSFKITFNNGLTKKASVTYETTIVDENAYKPNVVAKYLNNAKLSWTDAGEKSISTSKEVGIGRTVIQKSGNGYEANDNRYVKWTITINKDRLDVQNPVVTDILPKELEYVSHIISPNTEVWTIAHSTTGTGINVRDVITFTHNGTIDKTYTISLITRIKDGYKDIYGANKEITFTNEVSLIGDNATKKTTTAQQIYQSTVISKSNTNYDYNTRLASWEIVVNQNKMTINNAIVTDTIGDYHEFVDGSLTLGGNQLTQVEGTPNVGEYSVLNKVVTINIGKIDKVEQKITYNTVIPDEVLDEFFGKNSTINTPKITNSATLTGTEIKNGGQKVTSEKPIKNTVISKTAKYTTGNDFIEWLVEINLNQLDFGDSDVTLEDTLQNILILDKNSVMLYELTMKPDGTYESSYENNIVESKVEVDYDILENKVEFKLGKVNKAYLLKFTTDINSDKLTQTISNTISLKGHSTIGDNATGSHAVSFNNVGGQGGGSKTRGSIKIIKVDDYNSPIQGVSFELFNNLKNSFNPAKISVTNNEGIAYFDDLPMGTYWVKEVNAPEGYVMLEDGEMVTLSKGFPNPIDPKNRVLTRINERIVKDSIQVKKADSEGKGLKGAKFDLYKQGVFIESKISGDDGLVTFNNIVRGEYRIEEVEAPAGYIKSDSVIYVEAKKILNDSSRLIITYSKDGSTFSNDIPEIENKPINIVFFKMGKNDAPLANTPLKNVEFELYDLAGKLVKAAVKSEDNGRVIFTTVPVGTYTIKETTPTGYKPYIGEVTVTVAADGTTEFYIDGVKDTEVDFIIENELVDVYANVVINKTYELKNASGAVFGIYIKGENTLFKPVETEENGEVTFENIPLGNYVIREISAPDGYMKSDAEVFVKVVRSADLIGTVVTYSLDGTNFESAMQVVKNESINIEFKKTDSNGDPIEYAEFELSNADRSLVHTNTSNAFGEVIFTTVPAGTYTIKEIKAPNGYRDYKKEITAVVTLIDDGKNATVEFSIDGEPVVGDLKVINERIPSAPIFGKIAIKKVDEDKKVLSGAEFTLYDENGKVVERGVTGSDGILSFENLALGKYVIKETKAPVGYVLDENETDVTINNAQTRTYTFTNKKEEPLKPGRIEIIKTDNDGNLLSEAWFSLVDENGSTLQNVETVDGYASFEDVPVGKYTVKEVQAPLGYELSSKEISVTVESEKTLTVRFVNKLIGTPTVVPAYGNITIYKVDENAMALSGAEFTLYNENNEIIGTAVSNESGRVMFESLVVGKYFVKETIAPEGYELVDDAITVNIAESKVYSYKFINVLTEIVIDDPDVPMGWEIIDDPDVPMDTIPTLPDTGSWLNTWIMTLIGLVLILTGIILYGKRKLIS